MSNTAATVTALEEKQQTPGRLSTSLSVDSTPYWNVNVPASRRTVECPSYLQGQGEKNIGILSTPDEQYRRQGWDLVKQIVGTNRIDLFQRLPSDLRKYLQYKEKIIAECGSIMRFVVKKRLCWGDGTPEDLAPKGRAFECKEDMRILHNDWPYGLDEDIIHLVVWTKFDLEDDPATDDLTPRARQEINDFVEKTFCSRMPPSQVVWFKNWRSLKSVHAVEHFHVMLHKPDPAFVNEITEGDMPWPAKGA